MKIDCQKYISRNLSHMEGHYAGYNGKWKTFLDGVDFADKISSRQKILDFLRIPEIWNYFNSWK